jgi:hypothetical protein
MEVVSGLRKYTIFGTPNFLFFDSLQSISSLRSIIGSDGTAGGRIRWAGAI